MKSTNNNHQNRLRTSHLIIVTGIAAIVSTAGFAQDTLFYKSHAKQIVSVIEVSANEIIFRKASNPNGPTYSEVKSWIQSISYSNGTRDIFSDPAPVNSISDERFSRKAENPNATMRYGGPKVGVTFISDGAISDGLRKAGKSPFITQFGWQFEKRFFTMANGMSGVVELIPLIGGLEQGIFQPSATILVGLRGSDKHPIEFGMGPNYSLTGFGMVFALGTTIQMGDIHFPIHLAYLPSITNKDATTGYVYGTGHRISLLIGFNMKRRR